MTSINDQQKKMLVWRIALSILVIAIGVAIFVFLNPSNKEQEKLRIGAILPLTGSSASWGTQGKFGIELAIRDFNKAGGIEGKQVSVLYQDSQAVPRLGISAFNKLTLVDGVPAVVGDIVSSTTLAMAPYAEEQEVVLIGISTSAPAITDAGDFIFRVWPSDNLEGAAAADWAYSEGYRKVSVLHMANDYGMGLAKVFRDCFTNQGGSVVSTQSYPQDQTSFRINLARVRADTPDLLYIIGYYKDVALVLKQAKEMGLSLTFMGPTAAENPELLTIAGDAAEGLVYLTIVDFDPANPSKRQTEFIKRFKAANDVEPDWASSHAYDATMVILEAMKSGARTGKEIRAAIDTRRLFEGVTGTIRFDDNGDVIDKRIIIKTVRNGRFTVLRDAD